MIDELPDGGDVIGASSTSAVKCAAGWRERCAAVYQILHNCALVS